MVALAVFCLRLAVGLLACLTLLAPDTGRGRRPPAPDRVGFKFYRTHFLTALGLACAAALFLRDSEPGGLLLLIGAGMALCVAGSVAWALEGAPGGRALVLLTPATLAAALVWLDCRDANGQPLAERLIGDATSAALLGTALTAMLLGHFYLISPALSIRPLLRLLAALAVALGVRLLADGVALGRWTAEHSLGTLNTDVALWLPVRWLVGFLAPLGLTWMAWQAARIRATQSATGILYVVVIFCFVGELTGLLLRGGGVTC
jgi:hypothetical protein